MPTITRLPVLYLTVALMGLVVEGKGPACNMDGVSYPPALDPLPSGLSKNVSWYDVDLDADPKERWTAIVKPRADKIQDMANVIEDTLRKVLGNTTVDNILSKIDTKTPEWYAKFPKKEYGEELDGIAEATGIEPAVIWIYNFAYTLFGACTSIVSQTGPGGEIYHGRNLDFGLWPAFTLKDGNIWKLAHALRPLIVNVRFLKGGKELYKSTAFAGFIGVLTASKQGAFSLTVDTRYDAHVDAGLIKWLAKSNDTDAELSLLTRAVFEDEDTYADAHKRIVDTKIIGPSYIILSGINEGEGAVITKGAAGLFKPDGMTIDDWQLNDAIKDGAEYYLVQTNYDHWKSPPKFDNRRDPAKLCMGTIGAQGANFTGLYNVLNAKPNLNDLTTYTTLMHAKSGAFESYRQLCVGLDCPLF